MKLTWKFNIYSCTYMLFVFDYGWKCMFLGMTFACYKR